MSELDADLALVHRLADEASAVALSYFQREIGHWTKSDGTLATDGDVATERAIRRRLALERPNDACLGEEEGQTGEGGRRWIVDAIDGTIDFAAGRSDWSTLIALEVDGEIVVGVANQPVHHRKYWAALGHGARWSDASGRQHPLHVSRRADAHTSLSYVPADWRLRDERSHRIAATLRAGTTPQSHTNNPALEVAAGELDVAIFLSGGAWDLAALAIIVEEAGGTFTDIEGRRTLFSGNGIFSNGLVHEAVVRVASASS